MLPYTTNRYKNKTSPDLSIMKRLGGTNAAKVQLLFETAKYICVKIIFSANIQKHSQAFYATWRNKGKYSGNFRNTHHCEIQYLCTKIINITSKTI